jgi:formate--tetrahydrofolate ligase
VARGADQHRNPQSDIEFVVAICGEIMTMPGLPRASAANSIDLTEDDLTEDGRITGLF